MFSKILLALDDSDQSRKALGIAKDLALKYQSEVFVVHVRERQQGRRGIPAIETPEDAAELLNEAVYELEKAGIRTQGRVRSLSFGRVAWGIVDSATAEGADIIVMGSRGRSDLHGLLLGSVSHKVIQLANEPVLVVR